MKEVSRHQLGFKGLREVHKTRAFRLVLLAGPRCRVGEHPVRILEEVVAEEKVRVGFNGFPPIRWYTICRGLVLTIENRHSTGRVLLGSPIARCGLDTRDPISQVEYSEDVHEQLTRSRNPYYPTREVVSLVSAISVYRGEVHRGNHDTGFAQRPLASGKL